MMIENITGLQHIGIPVKDIEKSKQFYKSLGFDLVHENLIQAGEEKIKIAFLELHSAVIELYQEESKNMEGGEEKNNGPLDHIALNVRDIESMYRSLQKEKYNFVDKEIHFIPVFEKGVKFFMVYGPDGEKIEFNQKL